MHCEEILREELRVQRRECGKIVYGAETAEVTFDDFSIRDEKHIALLNPVAVRK